MKAVLTMSGSQCCWWVHTDAAVPDWVFYQSAKGHDKPAVYVLSKPLIDLERCMHIYRHPACLLGLCPSGQTYWNKL